MLIAQIVKYIALKRNHLAEIHDKIRIPDSPGRTRQQRI